jgi:hypothetical protein
MAAKVVIRVVAGMMGAVWALLVLALPAAAQLNPDNLLYELVDQLQTGRSQPVIYGTEVRNVVASQTSNSGVYTSLQRLGRVTNIKVDNTTDLRGGVLYHMTATHQRGSSTWYLGYSNRTHRLEYVHFTVGHGNQASSGGTAPRTSTSSSANSGAATQSPGSSGGRPTVSPGITGIGQPSGPSSSGPPSAPPPPLIGPSSSASNTPPPTPSNARPPAATPTQAPRPPSSDASSACVKFPNLC